MSPPIIRTVQLQLLNSDGTPNIGARARFTLRPGSYQAEAQFPSHTVSSTPADTSGRATVDLWANEEGLEQSVWRCTLPSMETFEFTVPAGDPAVLLDLSTLRLLGVGEHTPQGASVLAVMEQQFATAIAPTIAAADAATQDATTAAGEARAAGELAAQQGDAAAAKGVIAAQQGEAAAAQGADAAGAAAEARAETALTAAERGATALVRAATDAVREATEQERIATAAVRAATEQERQSTEAERLATAQERTATEAVRLATEQVRVDTLAVQDATDTARTLTEQATAACIEATALAKVDAPVYFANALPAAPDMGQRFFIHIKQKPYWWGGAVYRDVMGDALDVGDLPVDLGPLTHTRAGIASYTDADLRIADAAAGVLRSGHYVLDPVTGVYVPSVLLEGQATNLIPGEKQKFAGWLAHDGAVVTPTQGQTIAPTLTSPGSPVGGATRIQVTGGGSTLKYYWQGSARTGTLEATSVLVQNIGARAVRIGTNGAGVSIDVLPGTTVYVRTATSSAIAGNMQLQFRALDAAHDLDFVAYAPQVEAAAVCSSPILADAGVASRVADLAYYTGTGDSPLTRPQASWWYIRFIEGGTTLPHSVWQMSSAGAYLICYYANGSYRVSLSDGAASALTPALGALPVLGDRVELLALIYQNGLLRLVQSINGTPVASQEIAGPTLPPAWGNSHCYINNGSTGFHGLMPTLPSARGELVTVSALSAAVAAMTPQQQMDYARTRYQYEAA